MKKITFLSVLMLCLSTSFILCSCVKKDTTFTISLADQEVTTNTATFDGKEKSLVVKQINSDIINLIKKSGGDPTKIKSVKLKSFKLSAAVAGENFDKVDYIVSHLLSSVTDTVGTKLAYTKAPSIPKGSTSIDFENNYTELINYFKTDAFFLKLNGYNNADIPAMKLKASMSVDVVITP